MSLLELDAVNVSFGGLQALRDVTMRIELGQIHGLIGPNGAGKTTLINVLSRFIRPGSGTIRFNDHPLPARPDRLRLAGISRTFQTPAVFAELTALENVMVGAYAATSAGLATGVFRSRGARREETETSARARELLDQVGFDGNLSAYPSKLSFGNLRKIECARALMCDPTLLLLDEPTAGFTRTEVGDFAELLRAIHERSDRKLTILLVEHNVPFIFGLCDHVSALDNGQVIGTGAADDIRKNDAVIRSYLGYDEPSAARPPRDIAKPRPNQGRSDLVATGVTAGYGGVVALRDVAFSVREGEIVAVLGRNGAGKSTLLNALMRSVKLMSGHVVWRGRRIDHLSTESIVSTGIALVPQERGVIERQTVTDNLRLATTGLALPHAELDQRLTSIYGRFPRLAERKDQLGGRLSGGERRMLAIAKVLMRKPLLLLLDEPSIGLARGVIEELGQVVDAINAEGTTVVIAEQNVGWVVPLADRGYQLDTGSVVREGSIESLTASGSLAGDFLGPQNP